MSAPSYLDLLTRLRASERLGPGIDGEPPACASVAINLVIEMLDRGRISFVEAGVLTSAIWPMILMRHPTDPSLSRWVHDPEPKAAPTSQSGRQS